MATNTNNLASTAFSNIATGPTTSQANSATPIGSTGATPTPVPTQAPTAPSANSTPTTSSQPSTPTTVVGTGLAQDHINNTVIPALTTAQAAISKQNAATAASQSLSFGDGTTYDSTGKLISGTPTPPASNSSTTTTPSTNTSPETTPGTPEYQVLNTPNAGYHFEYAPDGTRTEVANGTNQPGFSLTPPANPETTSSSVTQENGVTIKQFADGTYGSYDAAGNYQGTATSQQYQDAQTSQTLSNNIAELANGTYPLTSTEQAQVTALQNSFAALVTQQETANANLTGGTTIAENLYGMGTSLSGVGQIQQTVTSGLAKIADLNNKMVSAVSSMETAFQQNDLAAMKDAYDVLTGAQTDRQNEIDKLNTAAEQKAKDMEDTNIQIQNQKDAEAKNTFDEAMANATFTEQQKNDAFNQYIQQADLTEKEKQDAVSNYYSGVTASHEAEQIAISQAGVTGIYTDPSTGKSSLTLDAQKAFGADGAAISSATQTLSTTHTDPNTGQQVKDTYVDGTSLSDEQKAAAQGKGMIVLGKDAASTMSSIGNVQSSFGSFLSNLQQAGILNSNLQFVNASTGTFSLPTSAKGQVKTLNTQITDSISALKNLPNTGDLISTLNNNVISPSDSSKTIQTKITNITHALTNAQNSVLSTGVPQTSASQPSTVELNGKTLNLQSDGTYL